MWRRLAAGDGDDAARAHAAGGREFQSPTVAGYRFTRRPLPVIIRSGDGPHGSIVGYEVYFRLNRALPRSGTTRGFLADDSGFPAAGGIGQTGNTAFWQPIDGGPSGSVKAGDPVAFRVQIAGIRKPLQMRVSLPESVAVRFVAAGPR